MSKISAMVFPNAASSANTARNNFSDAKIAHRNDEGSRAMPEDTISTTQDQCKSEEESLQVSHSSEAEEKEGEISLMVRQPESVRNLWQIQERYGSNIQIKDIDEAHLILTNNSSKTEDKVNASVYLYKEAANGQRLPEQVIQTTVKTLNDPNSSPYFISLSLGVLIYAGGNQELSLETFMAATKHLEGNNSALAIMATYQISKTYVKLKEEMPVEGVERVCSAIASPQFNVTWQDRTPKQDEFIKYVKGLIVGIAANGISYYAANGQTVPTNIVNELPKIAVDRDLTLEKTRAVLIIYKICKAQPSS